jgi:hypothetical protein
MKPSEQLRQWLESGPGPWRIGQAAIRRGPEGYVLAHAEDAEPPPATGDLAALRAVVRETAGGQFRPLKAEPNLRTGWSFGPFSAEGLLRALGILYPTSVANWTEWKEGRLRITPFRETAERQTGMYTIVKNLSDAQAGEVVRDLCEKRCLKARLWSGQTPRPAADEIPLLCPECCSLFISTCRAKLKGGAAEEE